MFNECCDTWAYINFDYPLIKKNSGGICSTFDLTSCEAKGGGLSARDASNSGNRRIPQPEYKRECVISAPDEKYEEFFWRCASC